MDGDAVRKIQELALAADAKEKDGQIYVKDSYRVLGVVHTETITFSSLDRFCEFVADNPQGLELSGCVIKVNPDLTVSLLSRPDARDGQRTVLAHAEKHKTRGFEFGTAYDIESFIIGLRSFFVKEDDWQDCYRTVSKTRIESGVVYTDDGMGMKVEMKTGVSSASIESSVKPCEVRLRPYRIFTECVQPASVFFLRLAKNRSEEPVASLYETDGGNWKIEASKIIRDHIVFALGDRGISNISVYY